MTNQRFKKKKIKALSRPHSWEPAAFNVALSNCQLEQVGYTVPLNSGQAEVASPQEAPLEAIPVLSPWDLKIIFKPFPDSGLKRWAWGFESPAAQSS